MQQVPLQVSILGILKSLSMHLPFFRLSMNFVLDLREQLLHHPNLHNLPSPTSHDLMPLLLKPGQVRLRSTHPTHYAVAESKKLATFNESSKIGSVGC
jgi:hypothetical protein